MLKKNNLEFDRAFIPDTSAPYRLAGVDEAGRGPLAGPVVAACVLVTDPDFTCRIHDSKQLSPKAREEAFGQICQKAIVSCAVVSHERIDAINIYEATKEAMLQCVEELSESPDLILIDGNMKLPLKIPHRLVVGGDGLSFSIACASIVAKVTRDRLMREYHDAYPEYGFDKHKGYGTAAHVEAIKKLGPCPIHRRSFEPVASLLRCCLLLLSILLLNPSNLWASELELPEAYYSGMVHRYAPRAKNWNVPVLKALIENPSIALQQSQLTLPSEELREHIVDSLNFAFLEEELNASQPEFEVKELPSTAITREREVLVKDPVVGEFSFLWIEPLTSEKPKGVILGLHGHKEDALLFADKYQVRELAQKGFVIVIPTFRSMQYDRAEYVIAKRLLIKGFTLMAVRVYEAERVRRWVQNQYSEQHTSIGILAHSGGSSLATLWIHLFNDIRVLVRDHAVNFLSKVPGELHCETIPNLYPYYQQINSTQDIPTAIIERDYGALDDSGEVFEKYL